MRTFLPAIGNAPMEHAPSGAGEPNDEFVQELFDLMSHDPAQQRPMLMPNDKLMSAAYSHAVDMATRDFFSHETPDHIWPNQRVREAGYHLPDDWPNDKNYVESICAGQPTPQEAWNAWMHSESHSRHLLGLTPFFAAQTNVGIGYTRNDKSIYHWYWCVVSAPPEQ